MSRFSFHRLKFPVISYVFMNIDVSIYGKFQCQNSLINC